MPYKRVKSKAHYGKHFIMYNGHQIEVPHLTAADRLTYVECSCGKIVQRQGWTISHIKTPYCREFHFFNREIPLSFKVRDDIGKTM
jgi:hypothetical protein